MDLNVFMHWWSNSNILFLASIDRTSNFEPNRAFTRFTKLFFELTQTSLFWTSNELERVHLFLASNEQTLNIKPNRAFTRFTELLIELTRTTFFQISNELERVHLLVIKLKHLIFGFERSNIEFWTLFNPSLIKRPKILEHYIRMVNVHIDTYTVRCTIHEPCLITRCWLPALTSITNFVLEIDCIVGNYFAGRVRH